jgi:hypothetical protein
MIKTIARRTAGPPLSVPRPVSSILDRAQDYRQKYERLKVTHRGKVEKVKDMSKVAVRTFEVATIAAGFGYVQGRFGPKKVGPIPLDLLLGGAGHIVGFMELAGEFTPHLHNLADGAIASFANTWGRGVGRDGRAKSGQPPLVTGSIGAMPVIEATGGGALSNEELNRLNERL